jgi:hypothetical protein
VWEGCGGSGVEKTITSLVFPPSRCFLGILFLCGLICEKRLLFLKRC